MSTAICFPPRLSDATLGRLLSHAEHGRIHAPMFCEWLCDWIHEEQTRRGVNRLKDEGQADDSVPYMEPGTLDLPDDLFGVELVDGLRLVRAISRSLTYAESDLIDVLERIEEHLLSSLCVDYKLLDSKRV